ncbi:MAG TPA: hypothetical protein VFH59_09670 [Frateuria sp.]|uniref:hypothetical protein n=1 Tax=Frateuria sp. TaxID=2211372 RepID=UPI002D7FC88C|nr:hypothetical protein [Frateuria sp.]HET6805694.1 hypothetical protein [Frateuria sp.]
MRHEPLRPYYLLGLVWLLLNLPLLLGVRVVPWDAMDEFFPTVYFNAHSLHHGLAPWWNPYIYSGFPQIADPQGMLFSPLLMAWMLLPADPGVTWFTWGVLLHLLLGAAGMLAFLQRKGANAFGALMGATVFMAGGVAASRLEHTPIVLAYAYVPPILFTLQRLMDRPGWQRGAVLGLVAGAFATHLVQVTYLFALMVSGYALVAVVRRWPGYSPDERRRWIGGTLLAVVLAAGMALPQLIFSWAYLTLSNRAALPLAASGNASLSFKAFLTLLDPNALHALRGSYDGPASRVEGYFYLGAVPTLLLAGLAGAWRQGSQRRQILFFAAVALLATLYMLGLHTPVYGLLYAWLPGMQHLRRPSDAAYLLNLAVSVLVGLAATHFRLDSRRHVTLLLAIAMLWLVLASLHMRGTGVRWQGATLFGAIVAGLALWKLRQPRGTWHTIVWLLVVLVADYRSFNLNGTFNQGHDKARDFRPNPAAQFVAHALARPPGQLKDRVENLDGGPLWDNLVVMADIPSTQGYNPLHYALYQQWYGAREHGSLPRVATPFNRSPASKLSDLLSVRYLVARHRDDAWTPPQGYALAFSDGSTDVWRNAFAYPRVLTPVHALSAARRPAPGRWERTDFRDTLWLTPRDAADRTAAADAAATCHARVAIGNVQATPTRVSIDAQAPAAGWLVLGDLDFPGWQADIDGRAVAIHRANGMFRAVCMPPGRHTLSFVFHPWAMVAQAWRKRPHG